MIKKLIYTAVFISAALFYGYLLLEEKAISIYGEKVGNYARNCTFVDAYFQLHEFHIRGKDGTDWIHGCPVLRDMKKK